MDNMNLKNDQFQTWLDDTDYTGPLGIVAKFYVKQEFREQFAPGFKKRIVHTRGDEGVRTYKINEDVLDPLVFWLTEEWESVAALRNILTHNTTRRLWNGWLIYYRTHHFAN